jgi:hypothetical protein
VVRGLQQTAGNAAVTGLIQRRAASNEEEDGASAVRDIVGRGGGQPLDPALKDEMEAELGQDLSAVRLHTDAAAARSAASLSARAYTAGDEVVLGPDAPALDSAEGKQMLTHELTHVIQQRRGPVSGTPIGGGISVSDPSDVFEQAAEANAARVMSPRQTAPAGQGGIEGLEETPVTGMPLQRQLAEEEEEEDVLQEGAQSETTGEEEAAAPELVAEPQGELAEAGQEEGAAQAAEEEAAELEIGEDEVAQAEAEVETVEEEEEQEEAAV